MTKKQPNDAVSVAVSSLVTVLVSPFAGKDDEPTAPVDSPAVWTLAAAARREFLGSVPALDEEADPTTTGLVADNVATLAAVVAADEEPQVVAIPQTSLLTPLQYLPIIGPLAVTPVIALLHQIPFVGDILHPIIGYPVGFTGGTTPRDVRVMSEDGTSIYVHFFPAQGENAGKPAPTILNGPGLGLPGETNPLAVDNPFLPNQVIGMGTLLKNGYNVVTWDPRGEWGSGGILQVDHPEFEGKDMQAIISWVAQQPEAAFDSGSETDPLIGMVGLSYGGGIQLVTAAIDPRVDAIVPTIAWNNINTALAKNGAHQDELGPIARRGPLVDRFSVESANICRVDQQPPGWRGIAARPALPRRTWSRLSPGPDHRTHAAGSGHRRHAVLAAGSARQRNRIDRQRC